MVDDSPADEPLQTEVPRVAPEPEPPAGHSRAAVSVADTIRAALRRARATEAKASAAGVKPSGERKASGPFVGPGEFRTSLRRLAAIFDYGHRGDLPDRLVYDGLLAAHRWGFRGVGRQKVLIVRIGPKATEAQRSQLCAPLRRKSPRRGRKEEPRDEIS